MKPYKLTGTNGKTYTLAGVIDSVKESIEDTVQARERIRLHRQMQKKLITADVYAMGQQSLSALTMQSEACLLYIATEAGSKHLFREMMIAGGLHEPTDADVNAVYDAQLEEGSEAWATVKAIWEDAYPKAPTVTGATRAGPRSRKSTAAATTGSHNSPTKTEEPTPAYTGG